MKSQSATRAKPTDQKGELSPRLRELQGSFALEGIQISDERLLEYAHEFDAMKNSGEVRERILKALGKRR
jgi:hypothetical protein